MISNNNLIRIELYNENKRIFKFNFSMKIHLITTQVLKYWYLEYNLLDYKSIIEN